MDANPTAASPSASLLARLWAVLRLRCPRCLKGKMFRGSFTMNDPCPVCGLLFQREEGYFLGAMYVSYVLASVLMFTSYFLGRWLLPDLGNTLLVILVLLLYVPLVPAVFRYSRGIWIYFERWICPSSSSATIYEKMRLQELNRNPSFREGEAPAEPRRP